MSVISYTYNASGIRTSKTVNGIKHEFTLDGVKILREVWGDNTLAPIYDNEETVCGIIYNGTPYYFLKNLQGDVISIVDIKMQKQLLVTPTMLGVFPPLFPTLPIATSLPSTPSVTEVTSSITKLECIISSRVITTPQSVGLSMKMM